MKIRVGDRVKFLNEVGEGNVVSVVSQSMVNVETSDGFELPVMVNQLVVIDSAKDRIIAKKEDVAVAVTEEEEQKEKEEGLSLGFVDINQEEGLNEPDYFLAFVPVGENSFTDGIDAYLVNNSNFTLMFQYAHIRHSGLETVESGVLEPNLRIRLKNYDRTAFNELPKFGIQLMGMRRRMTDFELPIRKVFDVNPVKFAKESSYEKSSFFSKNVMIIPLVEKEEEKVSEFEKKMKQISEKEIKKQLYQQERENRKERKQPLMMESLNMREIDLHIHELIDDTRGLSNTEMLKMQLGEFHLQMKRAIKEGVKKIVFIHGKGNGTLKSAVAKELRQKYAKYQTQDASFEKYGYGATLIILKR